MSLEKSVQDNSSILTIRPTHKPLGIAGFISILFIGFIVVLIQAIQRMGTGIDDLLVALPIGLFFGVAYYNFFNIFWVVLGSEVVEINGNTIKHTKCVWRIKRSRIYDKTKIKELKIVDGSNSFGAAGMGLFGLSNISVQFKYRGRKKRIGKQINLGEAKEIFQELKEKQTNH